LKLGVSIVNYFSSEDIRELIDSIVQTGVGHEVTIAITCNSCNEDEFTKICKLVVDLDDTIRVLPPIKSEINGGYANGNNQAAELLLKDGCEALWVLNPDARVLSLNRKKLNTFCEQDKVGIMATAKRGSSGELIPDVGQLSLWTGQSKPAGALKHTSSSTVYYPAGHSILVSRAAWIQLHGFSERYFLFCEEPDLILRAEALKIHVGYEPAVLVRHQGGSTTGATEELGDKSALAFLTASESKIRFVRTHRPLRLPIALLARLFYAVIALKKAGPSAARSVFVGTMQGLLSYDRDARDG
jgi:GT2 family glycosyltransferase